MRLAARLVALVGVVSAQFVNLGVEQNIDLTASYARQAVTVLTENRDAEPEAAYLVPFTEEQWDSLILFEAQAPGGMSLETTRLEDERAFVVELAEPLEKGQQTQFSYAIAFKNAITALPEYALQSDVQKLVYDGSKLVYSAYPSEQQTTVIKTVTTKVVDLATGQEASVDNKVGGIQFGPVKNVKAHSFKPLKLQYDNPLPQVRFTECNRTIWISHWSDAVSFDERYDIYNAGTKLKKPFSRLDFVTDSNYNRPTLSASSVRSVRIPTGPKAIDTYYVDLVGNISTSVVGDGYMDVVLRFPLFGGWRTEFTVGWAGSLASYVQTIGRNIYAIQIPIVRGPEGAEFDVVETTVILPEGATSIKISGEEPVSVSTDVVYSYLDLFGRPSITLTYKNLVGEHQRHSFAVVYEYSLLMALRKPIAYTVMVFGLFVAVYFFRNADFSIKKQPKQKTQ